MDTESAMANLLPFHSGEKLFAIAGFTSDQREKSKRIVVPDD